MKSPVEQLPRRACAAGLTDSRASRASRATRGAAHSVPLQRQRRTQNQQAAHQAAQCCTGKQRRPWRCGAASLSCPRSRHTAARPSTSSACLGRARDRAAALCVGHGAGSRQRSEPRRATRTGAGAQPDDSVCWPAARRNRARELRHRPSRRTHAGWRLIGRRLVHSQPRMVPSVAFTLGLLLTFGEPAIGSLIELSYEAWDFPEIQALLGKHQILTVVSIGAGVGLAMAVGATRLSSGATRLPLWRLVSPLALLCLLSTCVTPPAAQGLAWDAGAVTTGPCEVPSRPLALSPPSHPVALSLAYRSDHGPRHSRARRRLCPRERLGLWSRGPRLSLPGAVNRVQLLLDQAVCGRT